MKSMLILLASLVSFGLSAQVESKGSGAMATYTSKNKVYQITYEERQWLPKTEASKWDIEFQDAYGLVSVYFKELRHFVASDKIKETLREQFKDVGKLRNLKVYKKQLHQLDVDYFEFELPYKNYVYKYQGFFYDNGRSGSTELQFGGEIEAIKKLQGLIDTFCNGVSEVK